MGREELAADEACCLISRRTVPAIGCAKYAYSPGIWCLDDQRASSQSSSCRFPLAAGMPFEIYRADRALRFVLELPSARSRWG